MSKGFGFPKGHVSSQTSTYRPKLIFLKKTKLKDEHPVVFVVQDSFVLSQMSSKLKFFGHFASILANFQPLISFLNQTQN